MNGLCGGFNGGTICGISPICLIIVFLLFCGNNNGANCGGGCGGGCGCGGGILGGDCSIFIILILFCFMGNGFGGCGCGVCDNKCN